MGQITGADANNIIDFLGTATTSFGAINDHIATITGKPIARPLAPPSRPVPTEPSPSLTRPGAPPPPPPPPQTPRGNVINPNAPPPPPPRSSTGVSRPRVSTGTPTATGESPPPSPQQGPKPPPKGPGMIADKDQIEARKSALRRRGGTDSQPPVPPSAAVTSGPRPVSHTAVATSPVAVPPPAPVAPVVDPRTIKITIAEGDTIALSPDDFKAFLNELMQASNYDQAFKEAGAKIIEAKPSQGNTIYIPNFRGQEFIVFGTPEETSGIFSKFLKGKDKIIENLRFRAKSAQERREAKAAKAAAAEATRVAAEAARVAAAEATRVAAAEAARVAAAAAAAVSATADAPPKDANGAEEYKNEFKERFRQLVHLDFEEIEKDKGKFEKCKNIRRWLNGNPNLALIQDLFSGEDMEDIELDEILTKLEGKYKVPEPLIKPEEGSRRLPGLSFDEKRGWAK